LHLVGGFNRLVKGHFSFERKRHGSFASLDSLLAYLLLIFHGLCEFPQARQERWLVKMISSQQLQGHLLVTFKQCKKKNCLLFRQMKIVHWQLMLIFFQQYYMPFSE